MQLSMHNFILQYDGFHHLHFATSGLMQVVRTNSSSLKPSNPLGSTGGAASHDWRRHYCHMRASSDCSLNTEHNIPVEKHPGPGCQQWTKQWTSDFHHSGRFWQDGFFFHAITVEHICQNVSSVLHMTTRLTASVTVQQWSDCFLKISDSRHPFIEQKNAVFWKVGSSVA